MTKRLSIILLLLPGITAAAQSIRLTPYRSPSALYADIDRIYSYNRYEKSRLEAGLHWVTPSETAEEQRMFLGRWTVDGYVAYGFGDKAFKYMSGVQLRLPGRREVRISAKGYNDLEAAASRKLEGYRLLSPDYNTSFLASRFVAAKGGRVEVSLTPRYRWSLSAGALLNWEDYRFDGTGMPVYPHTDARGKMPTVMHAGLATSLQWNKVVTINAMAGRMIRELPSQRTCNYLRLLTQYSDEPGEMGLHVFAQAGYTTVGTPYSRLFDMSGTARAVYFFRNTFLTVPPYRFTANVFAHVCLNYTAPMPLWETSWSQPQPFLQLNAMWGMLHGQDGLGQLVCNDIGLADGDDFYLQAPHMGLAEMATGFDGLLRWGILDFGAGVAWQLCPPKAPYLNENPTDNFALSLVATLVFDKVPKRMPVTPTQPYTIIQNY